MDELPTYASCRPTSTNGYQQSHPQDCRKCVNFEMILFIVPSISWLSVALPGQHPTGNHNKAQAHPFPKQVTIPRQPNLPFRDLDFGAS